MGGGTMLAGGGIGTVVIVLLALFFGADPREVLQTAPAQGPATATAPGQDPAVDFVSTVLADTEDTWNPVFRQELGKEYQEPKLVLFTGAVQSACGTGQAAMGPFYCPLDHKVYIDLRFYEALKQRLNAPGDFAQAYVIAHEVGHGVQTQLGITEKVIQMRQRSSEAEANEMSVRQELQADCFAGVWANHAQRARNVVEPGDIEEALGAATAIGDDTLQRRTQGHVVPESFTHGTSEQRVRWFRTGYERGDMRSCDTFSAGRL